MTERADTTGFEPQEFHLCGPLPTGVTVLEASAGTGKTYTIAGLATRYVAEGIPLERLLLVTFTRMATGELRERVRERLVSAERGLARALAGADFGRDPVVGLLAQGPAQTVSTRRRRLARAVASFDAATIATTHGFCQEVLSGLGIVGDLEPDVAFVEDLSDLVSDVVDDLYVRRFSRGGAPAFHRAEAAEIARAAIENPAAEIVTGDGETPQMRGRLAHAARDELERRKRWMSVMTYDDLVTRLRTALTGLGGDAIAQRLRQRYDVVLVDEFQDTDPAQWDIMRCAFGEGDVALVLTPSRRSTRFAAPTYTHTSRPPRRPTSVRRSESTGEATRA
jgi:exodeoxyribonuclease V beta subunit